MRVRIGFLVLLILIVAPHCLSQQQILWQSSATATSSQATQIQVNLWAKPRGLKWHGRRYTTIVIILHTSCCRSCRKDLSAMSKVFRQADHEPG